MSEEVRQKEPHRRLYCFSLMLQILPYLLKMVVCPCWLQQIGHLPYDSLEYQEVELKNTMKINWLFRYGYRIGKAGEDPWQRRYLFGNKLEIKSRLQGIELPTVGPRLWASIVWQWAEEITSYYVVKVGEFMKLSCACEDIVSTGFSRH